MNTKIVAAILVAVVAVAGVGAVLLNGGDEPSKPVPGGEEGFAGYSVTLGGAVFGAEVESTDCPDGMKAVISSSGDSQTIEITGIPEGDTVITVTFADGKVAKYTLRESDGKVRITGERHDGSKIDEETEARAVYVPIGNSNWSYWTGNVDSPGVSDSVTPITSAGMKEIWKVQAEVGGASNWKTPGSAICVGEHTYYYNMKDSKLHCVVTSTGHEVASVRCESDSVFNMPLAYGDGKIFLPANTGEGAVLKAFDAESLDQLFVSEPVPGGDVQGAIVYHEGKVFFGTYNRYFACFDSDDTDPTRSDEVVEARWLIDGKGWYNMVPAFFGDRCIIVEKGYDLKGAIAYSVDVDTGAIVDRIEFDREYCVAGPGSYDGRVYIALNSVTDRTVANPDASQGKTLVIRSYSIGPEGTFDGSSEKVWRSSTKDGGTQSIPIIWNGRLYIGGGGGTMGTSEPFTVIDIDSKGNMTTAYTANVVSKSTASITVAYSQSSNNDSVYIYLIEYGHTKLGEEPDSTNGYAEIFCLRDSVGQKRADIVFSFKPSVDQFAYQSFTISPDGYVLIRNDSTLFCYGDASRFYGADDLRKAIDRIISDSNDGNVNPADVLRAESRYSAMTESEKARVTNYVALQGLYRTVTFSVDGTLTDVRVLLGSTVIVPPVEIPEGRSLTGWTFGNGFWNLERDRVAGDMTLVAMIADCFEVSFDPNGGSPVGSIWVVPGIPMGYVADPSRFGYSFDGWYLGEKRYIPQESTVSDDISLVARWLKDSTMSFDSEGGTSASPIKVTYSREVGDLPVVKKSGYQFMGWYYGDILFTDETEYPYEGSITVKAAWAENSVRTVEDNGVSVTGKIPEGAELTFAALPSGVSTKSITKLKEAAGANCEIYTLKLHGDGLDKTSTLTLGLPVGKTFNGKTMTIYYYLSENGGKVLSAEGTVENGILTVEITGNSSTAGSETTLAVRPGTELSKHEVL